MASDKVSKIVIVFMGQMFNLLLLFLLTPYLSRSLSKHEFGTFSQVQLLSTLIVAVFSLGLSRIFYLVIEKREFEKKDAFKTIMLMALFLGLAGSIASFFSSSLWAILLKNPDIQLPLCIYAPFFLINSLNLLLELTLIHKGLVRRDMTIVIVSNVLKLGLLLLSIQLWKSFTLIFWVIGTIAPLAQMIMYLSSIPLIEFYEGTVRRNIYRFIVKVGLPLGITGVLAASYTYLAGFFVSNMFNTEDFAIYRNGSFEIPFLGIIATSVASILTPQFANLLAEGKREEVARMKTLSISEVAAISYPIIIVILFFAKDLVVLYLSEKYVESTPIFFLYTLILFIRVCSWEDVLTGSGKTGVILRSYILYFIANSLLVFVFIHLFGLIGAAIASVICIYILAYVLLNSTARYLGVRFTQLIDFRKIGLISLYSGIICLSVKSLSLLVGNSLVTIFLIGIYFLLTYYILVQKKLLNIQVYRHLIIKIPFGESIYRFLLK